LNNTFLCINSPRIIQFLTLIRWWSFKTLITFSYNTDLITKVFIQLNIVFKIQTILNFSIGYKSNMNRLRSKSIKVQNPVNGLNTKISIIDWNLKIANRLNSAAPKVQFALIIDLQQISRKTNILGHLSSHFSCNFVQKYPIFWSI